MKFTFAVKKQVDALGEDKFLKASLFLFPLFAVTVRHWVSSIFLVLVLLGCREFFKSSREIKLHTTELFFLASLVFFFLVFIASSLLNGWDDGSSRLLERELRFLLFVPFYLLLRRVPDAMRYLGAGAAIGLLVTLFSALFQAYYLNLNRDLGPYGPLFTGPVSVIMLVLALAWAHSAFSGYKQNTIFFGIFLCTAWIAMLTSRSAIFGLLCVIILHFLLIREKRQFAFLVIFVLISLILFHEFLFLSEAPSPTHAPAFFQAFHEAHSYLQHRLENPDAPNPFVNSSIGLRLEMLRSVQFFLADYTFFGVGGYNYSDVAKFYIQRGFLAPEIAMQAHPHNVFAEVIVSKGILGLLAFIGLLASSFFVFLDSISKKQNSILAKYGIILLITIMIMMLTESAIVLKNNFVSVFLLTLGTFVSCCCQEFVKNASDGPESGA